MYISFIVKTIKIKKFQNDILFLRHKARSSGST